MGEGPVKTSILHGLLQNGFDVLEGSSKNVGKILSLRDGTLNVETTKLPSMSPLVGANASRWSPDVRVWRPINLVVEIQCRSVWGTQDALFSKNLINDLDRICSGLAQLFVFCCDLPIYRALLGDKVETRGRKAAAPEVFGNLFPPHELLGRDRAYYNVKFGSYAIVLVAGITEAVWGIQRVVLVAVGDKGQSLVAQIAG